MHGRSLSLAIAGITCSLAAIAADSSADGLSHAAAAIHQEVQFPSGCQRVYEVLTRGSAFDAMTRLSDAVSLVTAPGAKATSIEAQAGGSFVLFGGYITGRNLEMIPAQRLVQAWRAGSWEPGEYSIVEFSFSDSPGGCKLTFEHRGFPEAQGQSLLYGWGVHYWEPIKKLLARSQP